MTSTIMLSYLYTKVKLFGLQIKQHLINLTWRHLWESSFK